METPVYFGIDRTLVLLNQAEKQGEAEVSFKGYGRNPVVFTARIERTPTELKVYINNKFKKSCKIEAEVIEVLTKQAEEF